MTDIETGQSKDHFNVFSHTTVEHKPCRRNPYIYAYRDEGEGIFCFLAAGMCVLFLIFVVYMASK